MPKIMLNEINYSAPTANTGSNAGSNSSSYGTCSTSGSVAEKNVSCSGFSLAAGTIIAVKFNYSNTASTPTLNVNGTGAKGILFLGTSIAPNYLKSGGTYMFVYNGSHYELLGDFYDTPYPLFDGVLNSGTKSFSLSGAVNKISNQYPTLTCAGYQDITIPSKGILVRIKGYYGQSLGFCEEYFIMAPTLYTACFGEMHMGQIYNYKEVTIACSGYYNDDLVIYPDGVKDYGYIRASYSASSSDNFLIINMPSSGRITITNIDIL